MRNSSESLQGSALLSKTFAVDITVVTKHVRHCRGLHEPFT